MFFLCLIWMEPFLTPMPLQRAVKGALAERFASGGFPSNWQLFDWAALMEMQRPPSIVPMGTQKYASWHYNCQFYRGLTWYTFHNHTLNIMTQASGECGRSGNTALWDHLIGRRMQLRI